MVALLHSANTVPFRNFVLQKPGTKRAENKLHIYIYQ